MSKRLLIIIGVIVVILFGVGGFGAAYALSRLNQTITTSSSVATTSTTNPSSTNTGTGIGTGQANKGRSVFGVIQSLHSQTIVITMLRGNSTVNVTVSASTQYTTLDGQASFSDLKVGQTVNVIGQINTQDQALTAVRIILLPSLGRLTAINGQALTLMTFNGKVVQVNTSSTTIVYVPLGLRSIAVSAKTIKVGQILGYKGTTVSDGSVGATKLWLFGLPRLRGTVTSINGNVLTVQTVAGTSVTVNLGPDTTYIQGPLKRIPVASNIQALQVDGTVDVTTDSRPASGTSTAVLVIVVAA